jgi:hypothetical protein
MMRRATLKGALLLLASSAALAQRIDPLTTHPGLQIGAQVAQYRYEEPSVAKLDGLRAGFVGAYTFTPADRWFFRVDGRVSYGALSYQGSGSQDGVPDFIFEVRGVAGMDFRPGGMGVSPYLGLGYRYLFNDLTGYSSTGAGGYRRYSNYLYAPVGVTLRFDASSGWVFAPTGEFDIFIQGKQKSMLSDANAGLSDVTNTQKSGYGYRVYLMFEKDRLAIGPYLHYWHIDDSDVQPIGLGMAGREPENWTREIGFELRYRF